jgi:hypothetical protein
MPRTGARGTLICSLVFAATVSLPLSLSRRAEAMQTSVEVRQTLVQPKMTPDFVVMLTGTLALAFAEHWWAGAGYELLQHHDAILWTSETSGHKPIVLSALHAGCWYRGGETRHGLTYSIGALVTYANRAFSLSPSPNGLDNGTYFVDSGADMSIGYIGTRARLEVFMTPAWSYGRVASPAVAKDEPHSAFLLRMGVAFALVFGS